MELTAAAALEIVVNRTHHQRYRQLCDPDHPDYDAGCPATMIMLATGSVPPAGASAEVPESGPGWLQKAASLGKAVVEHLAAGWPATDEEHFRRRLATCHACEHYQAETRTCGVCGCSEIKLRWADQRCPIGLWEAVAAAAP